MKLTLIFLSALLALVAADTTTTADASATTANAQVQCAKACDPKDVCCIAKCYKVPCPSDSQANDTNKCVAACPQGTGTPDETKKYADCEQRCYSSHFFPADGAATTHGTETTVSGTSGTTATGVHAVATQTGMTTAGSGSKSANGEATKTGETSSSASASHTNAASNVKTGASAAGLFGLVLAAFAL